MQRFHDGWGFVCRADWAKILSQQSGQVRLLPEGKRGAPPSALQPTTIAVAEPKPLVSKLNVDDPATTSEHRNHAHDKPLHRCLGFQADAADPGYFECLCAIDNCKACKEGFHRPFPMEPGLSLLTYAAGSNSISPAVDSRPRLPAARTRAAFRNP